MNLHARLSHITDTADASAQRALTPRTSVQKAVAAEMDLSIGQWAEKVGPAEAATMLCARAGKLFGSVPSLRQAMPSHRQAAISAGHALFPNTPGDPA